MIAAILWTGIIIVGIVLWLAIRNDDKRIANEPCDEGKHRWQIPPSSYMSGTTDSGDRVCSVCKAANNNMRVEGDDDPRLRLAILARLHSAQCTMRNITIPDEEGMIRTRATGECTCDGGSWGTPEGMEVY